jgi:protein gp37
MESSGISWTDNTFNPVIGCQKVSEGCRNCYAEFLTTKRTTRYEKAIGLPIWGNPATTGRYETAESNWRNHIKWDKKAARLQTRLKVFCASLSDVFEDHPVWDRVRPRLWNLISQTPNLDWLILTKRPHRIQSNLPSNWGVGWSNVWLGTTVEDMRVAERADHLRAIPAVVRFISYEPAIGPLDAIDLTGIDWLIYGGESGPGYRKDDSDWAHAIRERCSEFGTAFFYKQSSGPYSGYSVELDGKKYLNFPVPRCV